MGYSSVRSTADTGKTVLALVAILSLVLSLFAIVQPAIATHGGAHLTSGQGTAWDDADQNANCPPGDLERIDPGETLWHFVLTQPEGDEATITVTFEREDGTQFTVTAEDDDSGSAALHFYVITDEPVTLVDATTDIAGGNLVLSHICNELVVTGSVLVLKTDDSDAPLAGVTFEFSWDSTTETIVTEADGLACVDDIPVGTVVTVEETAWPSGYNPDPNNPQTFTVVESDDCATRIAAEDDPDLTFVNEEILGSITINKEVECEVCETFTPGYYFNGQPQTPGYQDATRLLEDNGPIVIDGWTFADVQDVLDQTEPGSLLRHTLALQLNVWLAEENGCDLASQVFTSEGNEYSGMTVGEILAAALEILESGDPAFAQSGNAGFGDLHEAIDLINNNHGADDGVLSCEGTSTGAGFSFTLFDEEDNEVASGTTDENGTLTFSDLPLGTYTLVETGGPGENCSIVSATGEGVSFDPETGVITITLTEENADVTVTVVNECEEVPPPPPGNGELEVIKLFCPTVGDDVIFVFGPLPEEPIEFGVQGLEQEDELPSDEGCTLGAPSEEALGATFTITGGDLEEPLVVITAWDEILTLELAPGDYTIVEEGTGLTAEFTIEEGQDSAVVVFNFEEEEEEEGRLKILKFFCVGAGDPVFTVVDGDADLDDVEDLPEDCVSPEPGDATFTLTMGESTSGEFNLGSDGARLIPLAVGAYTLNEVDPNVASSEEFDITADGTTTVIVFNFADEGEGPSGGGPDDNETPRGGTLGGNPVPDTALAPIPTGSVPAALLALLMLSGLGAAAYAVRAEAQRRR
jgi:hypothetical protein